jgi:hypothetical protein
MVTVLRPAQTAMRDGRRREFFFFVESDSLMKLMPHLTLQETIFMSDL